MKTIRVQNLTKVQLLLALLLLMASGAAYSATITWTNIAGGDWSVAANWSPNQVPGSADTAQITTSGNYTVTNDQNSTVTSVTVGGSTGLQNLQVANGTVLTSASSSSTINANGSLTVAAGGTVTLAGSAYLYLYGPLTNSGTINVTNGLIYLYNNGTTSAQGGLVNLSGGLISLDGTGGIQGNVYGAGSSYDYFINGGTVTKVTGTGSSSIAVAQETLAGTYNAAAGTTVQFSGGSSATPLQEDPGLVLNGPGQYQFTSGFLLLTTTWNPGLQLTGGTLLLGPGFQGGSITNLALDGITFTNTLPVAGTLAVTNSTMTGNFTVTNGGVVNIGSSSTINANGSLTVAAGGTVTLAGSAYLYLYGPLTNSGTINVTNGLIYLYNNGTTSAQGGLVNLSGGLISLDGTGGIQGNVYGAGSSYDYFINGGTVTKVTGTGNSSIAVAQETLAGTYNAAAGTTVQFSGGSSATPLQEDPGLVLNGPGQYQFTSGFLLLTTTWNPGLQLTGGSLLLGPAFQGGSITNLALDGITFTNTLPVAGMLAVTNSTMTGNFTVTNGGVVNIGGSSATINANGSLTVASGGSVNLAGSAYLYLYGPLTNSGTINVTNGLIYLYNNGTTSAQGGLVNLSGGLISLDGTGGIQGNVYGAGSSYDYFINAGTVTKVTGTGSSSIAVAQETLAGTYNAAAGTTVQFSGGSSATPLQEDPGLVLNGPGQYKFTAGFLLLAAAWNPNLQLTGGALLLGPGFQGGAITNLALDGITLTNTLPVAGTLAVTNSTMTGNFTVTNGGVMNIGGSSATIGANGSLTVTSGGSVSLAGSAYLYLYGPLTNSGTINVTNGLIYMYNNGTTAAQGGLVNLSGGLISLDGTGGIQGNAYGAGSSYDYFINGGTVTKVTGTGSSSIVSAQGILAGIYNAAAGTTVQFSGGSSTTPLQEDPGLVLNGPGQYQFTGGFLLLAASPNPNLQLKGGSLLLGPGFQGGSITNLTLNGINLTNTLPVTGTLTVTNGSVNGVTTIASGGVLDANTAAFNGQVTVQSGARFLVLGGSATIGNGSTTNNWLTVQNGGEVDMNYYLYLYGPLTNSGVINVTNVYIYCYNNGTLAEAGGIVNLGTGMINLWNNADLYGQASGNEYLINQGAINMMTGSSSTINFFNLNLGGGTITTQPGAGTLQVSTFSGSGTLAGTYNAASNSIIQFVANANPGTSPGTPLVLGGAGQYKFNGGLLTLPTNTAPGMLMTGGSLLLGPGFQGGSITNLTLNGINLTNTLPVTGTLTVTNGSVNGVTTIASGGVLDVNAVALNGQVTVQSGARFLALDGSATIGNGSTTNNWLTVQNGGEVDMNYYLYLYGPLTNSGVINVTNAYIYCYNNGTLGYAGGIVNLGTGMINLWNNGALYGQVYGNEYLINQGAINMMTGSSSTINFFNLNLGGGTITTQPGAGTLQVSALSGSGTLAGTYNAASNSIIQFVANANPGTSPGTPLVLGGAGQYKFNGGLLTLPTNTVPGMLMTGGSLLLGPGFQGGSITNLTLNGINLTNTLPVTGTLTVTNGSVNGVTTIASGAVLDANAATCNGQVTVQSGARFLVLGGNASIGNGSATNDWLTVQNGGEVDMNYYLYLYGPLTNSGVINVTNVYIYCYNNGTLGYAGGIVNLGTGMINLWNNGALYGQVYGNEYLINQGAINMMTGSSSTINFFNLTNQAVLSVQHGTLQVQSSHLNLQSSETLGIGMYSQTDYGKVNLASAVPLTGALQVTLNGGYIPVATNAFTVVSYPSLSGSFSSFILPDLLPQAVWDPIYGGTTLTLLLQPPIATEPSGTNVVISINGAPGHQAILLSSTNLTVPLVNWTPVLTNTFGVTTYLGFTNNINLGIPQQFFRFKLP